MSASEDRLLSLLFEEGRVLVNLKFFPGEECHTADELFDAAHEQITASLQGEGLGLIPGIDGKKVAISDLVKSI